MTASGGLPKPVHAQDYPYRIPHYNFVRYDLNRLSFPSDSTDFVHFFDKIYNLDKRGEDQINIVHIGDSHIQADIITGRLKRRLQNFVRTSHFAKGYVFPYRLAGTNNPMSYYVIAKGNWNGCVNARRKQACITGVGGISATTYENGASIKLILRKEDFMQYDFNRVKVFHDMDSTSFSFQFRNSPEIIRSERNDSLGFSTFYFAEYSDTLEFVVEKTDSIQNYFRLYGFSLETDDPGFAYHSMGINGADVQAWLRSELLTSHLHGLNPDLIIISLGTNDSYMHYFDSQMFKLNYDTLLSRIQTDLPNTPVLLTTPGDHYRRRRYLNTNVSKAADAINSLAKKHNLAVWDLYSIMGGSNSIVLWTKYGLTQGDKLHFNAKGYTFQADLLFNAILKSYDNYLDSDNKPKNVWISTKNTAN